MEGVRSPLHSPAAGLSATPKRQPKCLPKTPRKHLASSVRSRRARTSQTVPKWHTSGHGFRWEGLRWDYGGKTEGVRWGYGITEGCLECAILAHIPRLAFIVNQQSLPKKTLLAPNQFC